MVELDSIVGVFDLDNTTKSDITRQFLKRSEKEGILISISNDLPKSFIVTVQDGIKILYLSSISSSALRGRIKSADLTSSGGNSNGRHQ